MNDIIAVHKQVERTLRSLTMIAEQAREGIIVLDLNGVIQFVNEACAAMHGYNNPDELVDKKISVFHTKEQMKTDVTAFIEEAKQRGQFAGRLGNARRDGTPFFTEMLMAVFNDDADNAMGLVGFATDLTEQERMKDELKRYRSHMEKLVRQQTERLEAANALLQRQVAEHEQAEQKLKQQTDELTAGNERLREQICERERTKDELELHCNKLQQRLREQSGKLTTATAQFQDEITRRKKQEEYLKQCTDAIKAAGARLQSQIDELSAGAPVDESDMLKTEDSAKKVMPLTGHEKSMLENVLQQNIVLQKAKLGSVAEEDL